MNPERRSRESNVSPLSVFWEAAKDIFRPKPLYATEKPPPTVPPSSGLDAHLDSAAPKPPSALKPPPKVKKPKQTLPYPGKFSELNSDVEDVTQGIEYHSFINGLRIDWAKIIYGNDSGTTFMLQHSVHFYRDPQQQPISEYEFGAFFSDNSGEEKPSQNPTNTMFRGTVSRSGAMQGVLLKRLHPKFNTKFQFQLMPEGMGVDHVRLETDFGARGKTPYSLSCTLTKDLQIGFSYLRSLHKNVAAGVELMFSDDQRETFLNYGMRYKPNPEESYTASYSELQKVYNLSYIRETSKATAFIADLKASTELPMGIATFGWRLRYFHSGGSIRGLIGSDGRICTIVEQPLMTIPIVVALGGEVNHMDGSSRFGIHFQIEMRTSQDFQDQQQQLQQGF